MPIVLLSDTMKRPIHAPKVFEGLYLRRHPGMGGFALIWRLGIGWALGSASASFAAEAGAVEPSLGPPVSVALEYQETPNYILWRTGLKAQTFLAGKPTAIHSQAVLRGVLQLGTDTNYYLPFAWNRDVGRLRLDLNRNGDFSDEPQSFSSPWRRNRSSQYFTNVSLTFKVGAELHPLLADLHFSCTGEEDRPNVHVFASQRSCYQGKLAVGGQEWHLAMVEGQNLAGNYDSFTMTRWLLLPWSARTNALAYWDESRGAFMFTPTLFFQNQAWRIEGRYEAQVQPPRWEVRLVPQSVPLGALKFTGAFVHRAVLEDRDLAVLLDSPSPVVNVPAGHKYSSTRMWLKQGTTEAYAQARQPLEVPPRGVAAITTGGPLTNVVTVRREGKYLMLSHQLIGVNGDRYRLLGPAPVKPPKFAIFQREQQLVAGNFEFG